MDTPLSQAFRSKAHPDVVTIPTRHDPKSKQRVVRWKDIQQFFLDAQGILNGKDAVLFLTDDDLDDLVPLRIAHHPGVILDVVTAADRQHNSSSAGSSSNTNNHHGGTLSAGGGTSGDARSLEQDTVALRITDIGDSQALVVHSQSLPLGNRVSLHASSPLYSTTTHHPSTSPPRGQPTSDRDQFIDGGSERLLLGMGSTMTQQDELRQLRDKVQQMQQQIDEMQQTMQQKVQETRQQAQETQQQMQRQMDEIRQKVEKLIHREQRAGEHEKIQKMDLQEQRNQEQQQQQQLMDQTVSDSREQTDEVLQNTQSLDQQTLHPQEHLQLPQEQSPSLTEGSNDVLSQFFQSLLSQAGRIPPLPEATQDSQLPKPKWLADDRLPIMKSRIQSILDASVSELSVPRLFIVLPSATLTDDSKGELPCSKFRLYFLCEFGPRTKNEEGEEAYEIHLANHIGHALDHPNEFFGEFGPYLLPMMYMFRLSSMANRPVMPMFYVKNTYRDHFDNVKKNFYGLIDEVIRRLEETAGDVRNNVEEAEFRMPSSLQLDQVKQYLKVEDGECLSGGLIQTIAQDGHCPWTCNYHRRQLHGAAIKRLQEAITSYGGTCLLEEHNSKINIKITSESLAKTFRKSVAKLCQRSSRLLKLEFGGDDLVTSTTVIFIDIINIASIELDFERLSTTIHFSKGEILGAAMEIDSLDGLTQEDLDFVQQCRLTELSIVDTPEEKDEERLIAILQRNLSLTEVRCGCRGDRSFAIINLVISTMEKIRQGVDSSALRAFKLDGRVGYFSNQGEYEQNTRISATMAFSADATTYDMESEIKLQDMMLSSDSPVYGFFRQYGWSITTLRTSSQFDDSLALLFDDSTLERGSKMACFILDPSSLTTSGLDVLDRAIKRSKWIENFALKLSQESERGIKTAKIVLERYGTNLTDIHIDVNSVEDFTSELAQAFPTRSSFPRLRHLTVFSSRSPQAYPKWITSMVSTPPPPPVERIQAELPTSLITVRLSHLHHSPEDWKLLVGAIDFSSLVNLEFYWMNISLDKLTVLVDRIESCSHPLLLKNIHLGHSGLSPTARERKLCEKIRELCPGVSISH